MSRHNPVVITWSVGDGPKPVIYEVIIFGAPLLRKVFFAEKPSLAAPPTRSALFDGSSVAHAVFVYTLMREFGASEAMSLGVLGDGFGFDLHMEGHVQAVLGRQDNERVLAALAVLTVHQPNPPEAA